MKKILAAVAMTAVTAGAGLAAAAPASASPDWLPDEVVVQALPDGLATEGDTALIEALGAQPGDTLAVTWVENGSCLDALLCPVVQGSTQAHPIAPDTALVAPAGPDAPAGGSVYPAYTDLVTYDSESTSGTLGNGPYDRAPGAASLAEFVPAPEDGTPVWVSEETYTDALSGEEWVRIGWGTNDAWVLTSYLDANVEPPVIEPTEEPTVEPTEAPTTEPAPAADDTDSDTDATDDSSTSTWLVLGGIFAAALALSVLVKRRKAGAATPTEES